MTEHFSGSISALNTRLYRVLKFPVLFVFRVCELENFIVQIKNRLLQYKFSLGKYCTVYIIPIVKLKVNLKANYGILTNLTQAQ